MWILLLSLCLSLCYGQLPVRVRSVSNPNRFDFSLLAVDTSNDSILVGGSDYVIRIGSDFRQDTITNVANLPYRVSLVEYDHFDNRFFVCDRDRLCHFYATSDITTSVANLSSLVSDIIPTAAIFTRVADSPSVYLYSSYLSSSVTSTRYTLQAFQLSNLPTDTSDATFTGLPVATTRRTLLNHFIFGDRTFFLVRQDSSSTRLFTLCNNTGIAENMFVSVLEIVITACDTNSQFLVSGRVATLQDGQSYLVLVYRTQQDATSSNLCAIRMTTLLANIDANYNNYVYLSWVTLPGVGQHGVTNPTIALNALSQCDYSFDNPPSPSLIFTFETTGYLSEELLPSVYSGNTNGRVVNLFTYQVDTFFYLLLVTEEGYLFKYYINGNSLTSDVTLLEERFLSNTFRDRVSALVPIGTDHILALTPRELLRIPVSDCERHESCLECVSDRDPLCGWCSVENSCQRQSLCSNSNLTYRWIADDVTECLSVTAISPNSSNINIETSVTISAVNLPELEPGNTFQCVFSSLGSTEVSEVSGGFDLIGPASGQVDLTCQIPSNVASFTQSESRVVQVFLSSTESPSTTLFSDFNFTFFDCGYHSTCQECVSSTDLSPCGWCVYSGVCTYSSSLCPALNLTDTYQWRQDLCPSIQSINPSTSTLVAEKSNAILLNSINELPIPQPSYEYECQLSDGMSNYNIPGVHGSNYVTCFIPADHLSVPNSDIVPVSINVTFGNRTIFTDTLQLYSCVEQGTTCAQCLSNRQEKPLCVWCVASSASDSDSDTCAISSLCQGYALTESCPAPFITSVSPSAISVYYTDQLVIRGTELGIVSDELKVSVAIQGNGGTLDCVDIQRDPQNIGREVNCTLSRLLFSSQSTPGSSADSVLTLSISNPLSSTNASHAPLRIVSPLVQRFYPACGPEAGGTRIRVSGLGLGVGTTRSASIIGISNCSLVSEPSNLDGDLVCVTEPAAISKGQFRVTIDGTNYDSTTGLFQFRRNPQVLSVNQSAVIGTGSGSILFSGISLDASCTPQILFYSGRSIGTYNCTADTQTELTCPFPPDTSARRQTGGGQVNYTLLFDGFSLNEPQTIEVLLDPLFDEEEFRFSEHHHISVTTINRTIELTFTQSDDYSIHKLSQLFAVELELGGVTANLTSSVTYQQETLRVELFDVPVDTFRSDVYLIYVSLQDYRTPAGRIDVASGLESLKETGFIVVGGVLGIVLLVVFAALILVCILCCLRKRGDKVQAEVEKLIYEMDTIENRVAQACRTEFAELNTELGEASDLTQGVGGTVPYLSFHRFVMNVMFPGEPDHPVLHPVRIPPKIDDKEFLKGLELFDELLRDQDYFLSLVNCVESNRSFSLRDRSNIASLFALCMHEDIHYLTSVLKLLIGDLSERMVADSQSRAKLMFRRIDSVAEKLLSDWLAMLMYGYLIEGAGPSIHFAFKATKRQTEKGPVDVLTGEAKNSLAKEKILAQFSDIVDMGELETKVITDNDTIIKVRLLECDTISQAKLKIMDAVYCGQPVSQRPHVTELDLEVRSAVKGAGLILRDNDHTSVVQGEWKRVNTLSHYSAMSQLFKLVPRTQKLHGGQVFDYIGTLIQDNSFHGLKNRNLQEDEKIWHLTKPQDQSLATAKSKKLATEIYLMRLISTKNILQKYVDDMVYAIFPDVTLEPQKLAPPIKFLFDFLEHQAEQYDVDDKETMIRLWKNNSVPLRFWVNIIKNPNYLFDVIISETLDSSLTVIAQVFTDSCLAAESKITEDAQTTKILYNKEVPIYRERILNYYDTVSQAPPVSDEQLFANYTVPRGGDNFYRESALQSLYSYAHSCKDKLIEMMLDDGRFDQQVAKFEEICDLLSKHSNN